MGEIPGGRDPSWTSFSRLNAPWLEAAVGRGVEALRACIVCTERFSRLDRWNLVWGKVLLIFKIVLSARHQTDSKDILEPSCTHS